MPAPSLSYSPTDIGAAVAVLIGFGLDVLVGFFPQLQLDPTTRVTLMASLTVLTSVAIAALIKNRQVKHQVIGVVAAAQVAAQATASPAPAPPSITPAPPSPPPFVGGPFVITPVVPGASETHPTP